MDGADKVCVYTAPNAIEGNIVRGLLEADSIEVELRGEHLAAYPGLPKVGETQVFVRQRDEVSARAVVRRYENNRGATAEWTCANCGEINAASFETCWQCQASAPSE